MTTTNGTRKILASLEAERIYIASFANLKATSDELIIQLLKKDHGHSDPYRVTRQGTEGFISLEDSLLAGALAKRLNDAMIPGYPEGVRLGNDEAFIASLQWCEAGRSLERPPFWMLLQQGRGGQNVIRIHLENDIKVAAEVDRFPIIAELSRDPLRIVKI